MEMKKCSVEGCDRKHWAKGMCRNHFLLNKRNGKPIYRKEIYKKCSVNGCGKKALIGKDLSNELCKFHHWRLWKNIDLDRPFGNRGENNPRWNGGTSEYPNHSEMKRIRKEVLKEANNICQFCGGYANEVHHKDQSKNNHSKYNLKACCRKCNSQIRKPHTSKFKRLYGYTIKELIAKGIFKNYRQIPA